MKKRKPDWIIDNWRSSWKWVSMNCMALTLAMQGAWLGIPQDMRAALPDHFVSITSAALMGFGILGRFIKQGKK